MKQFLVNRTNLKSLLVSNNMSRNELCSTLGITYQCLTMKLKGKTGFTENEISILLSLFGSQIFLPNLATKNEAERRSNK